jgi:ABC-type Fe3+/spermidine/putrescine transport system ATPase subunit
LQRELNAKNDATIMLNLQLEKVKQQKAEEESLRRAAAAEVHRLKQEVERTHTSDTHNSKEVAQLKDSIASMQCALEKEKASHASAKADAQRAEEAAAAATKALIAERDVREGKLKREIQEASEHIVRLRADAKVGDICFCVLNHSRFFKNRFLKRNTSNS